MGRLIYTVFLRNFSDKNRCYLAPQAGNVLGSDFSGQRIKGRKRDILIGRISSFLLNRKTEHSALNFLSHKNAPRGRKMSGGHLLCADRSGKLCVCEFF